MFELPLKYIAPPNEANPDSNEHYDIIMFTSKLIERKVPVVYLVLRTSK